MGNPIWKTIMEIQYENPIWGIQYGKPIWKSNMEIQYDIQMEIQYGNPIWGIQYFGSNMEIQYG